jgi:16S rRNA (cytosine1402-N4)-methyltransferase
MTRVPEHGHEPVMVEEVVRLLGLAQGGAAGRRVVMDCTAGRGGHALQIARALAAGGGGMLIALDVDPENLKYARRRIEQAGIVGPSPKGGAGTGVTGVELRTFHANFAEAPDVLDALGIHGIDGLLADFGVSTNQLLDSRHGLSFNSEEPLDMRLDPRIGKKASDLLSQWDEEQLARVLREYAQERFARRIARKIVQTRVREPILTTGQLARLVRAVVPPTHTRTGRANQIDPATRTFQALRMAVNSELESIADLLAAVPHMMNPGGRAVFISFHSGEDRLVKQAIKEWEHPANGVSLCEVLTGKPLEPGPEELMRNPRSRSAKLRAIEWKGPASVRRMDANQPFHQQLPLKENPGVDG